MPSTFYVYADDPDAHVVYPITDAQGGTLDFAAVVLVGTTEVTGTWLGTTVTADGVSTRDLDIPLDTIPKGSYSLRLKVPGDNDVVLGAVRVR